MKAPMVLFIPICERICCNNKEYWSCLKRAGIPTTCSIEMYKHFLTSPFKAHILRTHVTYLYVVIRLCILLPGYSIRFRQKHCTVLCFVFLSCWFININRICQREITHNYHTIWKHHVSYQELTQWGRDKMAAISKTTLSSAFSWKKMSALRLKFHWSLFLRVQLTIFQHCFR